MKRVLLLIILFALQVNGQYNRNLVLISGNEEPIKVFINGKLINNRPLNEIRITGLTDNYYQVRVKFNRGRLRGFSAELYVPPLSEIVYEVLPPARYDRRGEFIIKAVYPVSDNLPVYNPNAVFAYGNLMNNVGQNIQNGQINININNTATVPQQGGPVVYVPGYEGEIGCVPPVTPERYESMLQAVKNQDFDDSKLRVAKQIIKQNACLTVNQLVGILKLFDFERNKLELAKFAYHYVYDIENYYKVNNVFDFDSSIKKLDAYIKQQG